MLRNFLRCYLLITEIAADVVRKFIDDKFQPEDFTTFLEKHKICIYHLQGFAKNGCCTCNYIPRQHIINKDQFEKLFVYNGKHCQHRATHIQCHCTFKANPITQLEDIDLTLLGALLNNCFTLNQQQKQCLTVIRKIRNDNAHYPHKNDIDETLFHDKWFNVSNAIEYLASCIGENYLKEVLDKIRLLKARTLSPEEYTDVLKATWQNGLQILDRFDSFEKNVLDALKNPSSAENRFTTEVVDLDETECKTDISISSAEVTIINGNNLCTVAGIPSNTSIKKSCTPNHGTQTSLNEGARDGKFTEGSTQPPSLTVPNLHPAADADSFVCCVSKAVGESFIDSPPVLKYRSVPDVRILQSFYSEPFGNQVEIHCRIESESLVTRVYWERFSNNSIKEINHRDNGYHGSTTISPSLTIICVTTADAGTYICHAINEFGKGTSNRAILELNGGFVTMFENKYFTNESTVITDARKITPTLMGGVAKEPSKQMTTVSSTEQTATVPSTEQIFQRSAPGRSGENNGETYKSKVDGMREKGRKTDLSYSLLVYAALRGSISLDQVYSYEFTEIAKTLSVSVVNRIKKTIERKLVPGFLTKIDNFTYIPLDHVVKPIIHSFGSEFKECLLRICSFDIMFDHVRPKKENTESDHYLEVESDKMAMAFINRMQHDKHDASEIGKYIVKLGKEINVDTLKIFLNMMQQCDNITFDHIILLLDGLTKDGTDFEVFGKLPTLYDAFKCKVDACQNTIFHYIVALYFKNEKYKLYMQHVCEKEFSLLQLVNLDDCTAIDYASFLGRTEVLEIVICGDVIDYQSLINRIHEMIKRGVSKLQTTNTGVVGNLINISTDNVTHGRMTDYTYILQLIGKDSEKADDFTRVITNAVDTINEIVGPSPFISACSDFVRTLGRESRTRRRKSVLDTLVEHL